MRNPLKEKLRNGEVQLGMGVSIGHPDVAEIIGHVGFDWVFLDMEHSPLTYESIQLIMQAMSFSKTVPVVRVAWNDIVLIKRALDIGAYGIVVPWVNSREEAIRAVQAIRYPPEGLRGFGPRRVGWGDKDYVRTAQKELLLIAQIETEKALNNIDEILSVEGIDACFVGPNDFSMSLGIWQQWENPKFKVAIDTILQAARSHKVAPGIAIVSSSPEEVRQDLSRFVEQGFKLICLSVDFAIIQNAAADMLNMARRIVSKKSTSPIAEDA